MVVTRVAPKTSEASSFFEAGVDVRGLIGAEDHLEEDLVLGVDLRTNLEDLDVVGDDFFEVGEDAGPADALAGQDVVEEDAGFEDGFVFGLAKFLAGWRSEVVADDGELLAGCGELLHAVAFVAAVGAGQGDQHDEGAHLHDEGARKPEPRRRARSCLKGWLARLMGILIRLGASQDRIWPRMNRNEHE